MDNENMHSAQGSKKGRAVKVRRLLLSVVFFAAVIFAGMLEYLTLTEYRPDETESVSVNPISRDPVRTGDTLRILTWNCGYGGLGDNADFFMDGGRSVRASSKERIRSNISGIVETVAQAEPDVIFLQEVDRDSTRSHHINENIEICNSLYIDHGMEYTSAFACNFNVQFIPYPIPPIGKVDSGLLTLTDADVDSAERIRLPGAYKWPVRLANYKRCLLMERIPLLDSGKELVLINLHMETFDNGDGKTAQTEVLREILEEEAAKGNYVIAGGDFDQTFSSTDVSAYPLSKGMWTPGTINTDEMGESLQCVMDSSVPTCRSLDRPYEGADKETFQYYVIDGFIVSSNIGVKSCKTQDLGFVCSDHNPVLMECVLK